MDKEEKAEKDVQWVDFDQLVATNYESMKELF